MAERGVYNSKFRREINWNKQKDIVRLFVKGLKSMQRQWDG